MSLEPGQQLLHYKLIAKIGQGGMGSVYEATDTRLDRKVALKVLPPKLTQDPERRARFRQEARLAASFNHPNIATISSMQDDIDRKYLTIASVEPQFYAALLAKLGDQVSGMDNQWDMENWPALKDQLAAVFKTRTREEWDAFFADADICYAPVLSMAEVRHHPHHQARGTFIDDGEIWQPAPAPRFSRTSGEVQRPPAEIGAHSREILEEFGFEAAQVDALIAAGAVKQAEV